jgi:hypothetical protein
MYKDNYAQSSELPEWLLDASKANAVTGATKERAVRYLKEQHKTLSQEQLKELNEIIFRKREIEVRAPELILPNDSQNIHTSAEVLFKHLAGAKQYFRQGSTLVRLTEHDADDGERLEEVTPEAFRSILGEQFECKAIIQGDRGDYLRQKLCSLDNAKALLAAQAFNTLPRIQAVLRSPVFAENEEGELTVMSKGYHKANGGTYVLAEKNIRQDIAIEEAREALLNLVSEFLFVTS